MEAILDFCDVGYLSNRPHFLLVHQRDNPRGMLGEHEKACESRAEGEWLTSFLSVLPTSQDHAGKPIESVVYCFYKITLSFPWGYQQNKP